MKTLRKYKLKDDFELLDVMLKDSSRQKSIFRPGSYWALKSKIAANEIKRCGIRNFRGSTNLIGLSYADGLEIDVRNSLNFNLISRLARWLTKTYPLNVIFDKQIQWTKLYAAQNITHVQEILNLKDKAKKLLKKYDMPYSLLGGCVAKATMGKEEFSIHYLDLLEQHDNLASHINFYKARSVFEIGGGFGANIHLLLKNYKNIKKVLYLDIAPNLYVGTQYLKAFYGNAVSTYRDLKHLDSIKFSKDNKIQIFCITPWQIEKFESAIDVFVDSHSFVEMPIATVKNYVDNFSRFLDSEDSAIALTTYDHFDLKTTFHPNKLPKFFKGRRFDYFKKDTLLSSFRENLYFVSAGKLSLKHGKNNE